jgi:asparagine synthase (glutamine-hydrolysing)
MTPAVDARAYLLIDSSHATPADRDRLDQVRRDLLAAGWRSALVVDHIEVFLGPNATVAVRQVHRRHIQIGTWRPSDRSLSSIIGTSRTAGSLGSEVVRSGWGRYILAWRDDESRLVLIRDPSGAIDCVWWRSGGLRLASDQPPEVADALLPPEIAIDWEVLATLSNDPGLLSDRPPLRGLNVVTPGDMVLLGDTMERYALWRPSRFVGTAFDDSPDALRALVDQVVAVSLAHHERIQGEISGGLDSAIVSGSVAAAGLGPRARFVNYFADWNEGDERAYALAAAEKSGLRLEAARKPVAAITEALLRPLGEGIRPALHGVDVAYDRDVARRLRQGRATALVTGQGGDAVFYQAPEPRIVVDRRRREGLAGFRPRYWGEMARWTRHSAWTLARLALWPPPRKPSAAPLHPWLGDAADLPPGKYGQVHRLANCQLFWSDCLRARAADLIHPLLSQPVMEHCLAIPADRLTLGPRDRGLARKAFAGRLPPSIAQRRDKGDLGRFYGHVVQSSLPDLRPFLMDGLMVEHRLFDRVELGRDLEPERLLWSPGANRPLLLGVLEVWAQRWTQRLEARWRTEISSQPIQDARV